MKIKYEILINISKNRVKVETFLTNLINVENILPTSLVTHYTNKLSCENNREQTNHRNWVTYLKSEYILKNKGKTKHEKKINIINNSKLLFRSMVTILLTRRNDHILYYPLKLFKMWSTLISTFLCIGCNKAHEIFITNILVHLFLNKIIQKQELLSFRTRCESYNRKTFWKLYSKEECFECWKSLKHTSLTL